MSWCHDDVCMHHNDDVVVLHDGFYSCMRKSYNVWQYRYSTSVYGTVSSSQFTVVWMAAVAKLLPVPWTFPAFYLASAMHLVQLPSQLPPRWNRITRELWPRWLGAVEPANSLPYPCVPKPPWLPWSEPLPGPLRSVLNANACHTGTGLNDCLIGIIFKHVRYGVGQGKGGVMHKNVQMPVM